MTLSGRITKAEAGLSEALIWRYAQEAAAETSLRPEEIFDECRRILAQYERYIVTLPGGKLDLKPALRAIAEGEGLDYEEMVAESKRVLRSMRARPRRR